MKTSLVFCKTLNIKLHRNISFHPILYNYEICFRALKGKEELQLCIFKNKKYIRKYENSVWVWNLVFDIKGGA
jgi:hypothetical protein